MKSSTILTIVFLIATSPLVRSQDLLKYTNLSEFEQMVESHCGNTSLTFEYFSNGPASLTHCDGIVSSLGDVCFAVGELADGFDIQVSSDSGVVFIPPYGWGNNSIPLMGAYQYNDETILNFEPAVHAFGFDLYLLESQADIQSYNKSGELIDFYTASAELNTPTFFGFISEKGAISKVILNLNVNSTGELFSNLVFGGCNSITGITEHSEKNIKIFPNPTYDFINIQLSDELELEKSSIYDLQGQLLKTSSATNLDVSQFSSGVYTLHLETVSGINIRKVFVKM